MIVLALNGTLTSTHSQQDSGSIVKKDCGKNIKSQKVGRSAVKCGPWIGHSSYTHRPAASRTACKRATQDQANQNSTVHEIDDVEVPALAEVFLAAVGEGKGDAFWFKNVTIGRIMML